MRAAILLCLLAAPVAVGLLGDPLATDMRAVLLPPSPEHQIGRAHV